MMQSRLPSVLILIICVSGITSVLAEEIVPTITGIGPSGDLSGGLENFTQSNGTMYFFFNRNCHECHLALSALGNFSAQHPEISIRYFDIFNSPENESLFQEFNRRYDVPLSPVPALFVDDTEVIGAGKIEEFLGALPPGPIPTGTRSPAPTPSGTVAGKLTIPVIVGAAILDGINPCAFAVLIFLLISLISLDSRRKILTVGFAYIAAVFLFYLLSGIGLFAIVQVSGTGRLLSAAGGVIAIVAGILMIRDAFSDKPWFVIPEEKRGLINAYVGKASVPAAIILGILVGMFELPCTGGVYLAILALLSGSMSLSAGIPFLILYNLVFVAPLVIIVIAVYLGLSTERVDRWRLQKRSLLRVAIGVLMIALGIAVLSTLV